MDWFRKAVDKLKGQGGLREQDFSVCSAEKLRDEDPRGFSIPRSEQRRSLRVGDSVKLILEATNPESEIAFERPWAKVVEVSAAGYKVKFDNSLVLFPSMSDAVIEIRPEHVAAVILPDEYVLPFGKVCLVSPDVLEDSAWPMNLVRVPGDEPSDSGWRIWAEGQDITAATQVVLCDEIMSIYQVLDSVMDEPDRAAWRWSHDEREYKRVGA